MPHASPSNRRGDSDPPPQVNNEAVKGFFTGALRYGSLSILAHLILILPHPMDFAPPSSPAGAGAQQPRSWRRPLTRLAHRPLTSLSASLAPASKVYRGLTPQFKVFIQIAAMTLGGCIWAEHSVSAYSDRMRRQKRAERMREEAG